MARIFWFFSIFSLEEPDIENSTLVLLRFWGLVLVFFFVQQALHGLPILGGVLTRVAPLGSFPPGRPRPGPEAAGCGRQERQGLDSEVMHSGPSGPPRPRLTL